MTEIVLAYTLFSDSPFGLRFANNKPTLVCLLIMAEFRFLPRSAESLPLQDIYWSLTLLLNILFFCWTSSLFVKEASLHKTFWWIKPRSNIAACVCVNFFYHPNPYPSLDTVKTSHGTPDKAEEQTNLLKKLPKELSIKSWFRDKEHAKGY